MEKTLVVWRRFGKEHGEDTGFQVNSPSVVETHIRQKVQAFRQTSDQDWRWWQLDNGMVIEKYLRDQEFHASPTIYYLPEQQWALMQNPGTYFGWQLGWYCHIGSMQYQPTYDCWLFTDFFADVIIDKDNRTHSVLDLDDVAEVFELGLIDRTQVAETLISTQVLVDLVRSGHFPPTEILECQRLWLQWSGDKDAWDGTTTR